MKSPNQARPIMRSVRSVRRSDTLSSVTASECDMSKCGPAIGACAFSAPFGPGAVAACLGGVGVTGCRDCIGEAMQHYADLTWGHITFGF